MLAGQRSVYTKAENWSASYWQTKKQSEKCLLTVHTVELLKMIRKFRRLLYIDQYEKALHRQYLQG